MSKTIQIAILAKIVGNVNADETIGTRVTLKKMHGSNGEVLPFVSARALKHSIRQAFEDKGYTIDPFNKEGQQLNDSGNPVKFVDNDLFGYMSTRKGKKVGEGGSISRQAPIALSYLKALYDTPVTTEFGARFPRGEGQDNPVPFEIEVAEFIGRLNCIVYDYIGKKWGRKESDFTLQKEESDKRIKDFLDIFLTPSYVLPRRTNSLNIPEYISALVILSKEGPKPIYQYLDYKVEDKEISIKDDKFSQLCEIKGNAELFLIDYNNCTLPENVDKKKVKSAIEHIHNFYCS